MSDDMIDIGTNVVYSVNLTLKAGGTARATVTEDGGIVFDTRDGDGQLVPARLGPDEAREISAMMNATDRAAQRTSYGRR
jgi:hypothetical protein